MGYFKRPIRRSTAATIRQPRFLSLDGGWQPISGERHTTPLKFVRFCVPEHTGRLDQALGVFHVAGRWARSGKLDRPQLKEIGRVLRWFNQHLSMPNDVAADAVFWFKGDSKKCIEVVWNLVHLLRDLGDEVMLMTTDAPGRIVYDDQNQIAAIRFNDRPANGVMIGK